MATDPADVPADMLALANVLDPKTAVFVQGTAAPRPAAGTAGRVYYATDTGVLSYDTGSAWLTVAGTAPPGAPPIVTVLPDSPVDGAEVYFDAGGGVHWHLRYSAAQNTADGYGWVYVGGPALRSEQPGSRRRVGQCEHLGKPHAGASTIPVPLGGYYDVEFGAVVSMNAAGPVFAGVQINGTDPNVTTAFDGRATHQVGAPSNAAQSLAKRTRADCATPATTCCSAHVTASPASVDADARRRRGCPPFR